MPSLAVAALHLCLQTSEPASAPDPNRLSACQAAVVQCHDDLDAARDDADEARDEAHTLHDRLRAQQGAAEAREQALCAAAGEMADAALQGRPTPAELAACVPPATGAELRRAYQDKQRTLTALTRFRSEVLGPAEGSTSSDLLWLLQDKNAYLPLLRAALQHIAPRSMRALGSSVRQLAHLATGGPPESELRAELHERTQQAGLERQPGLLQALEYLHAYGELAGCNQAAAPAACTRAKGLIDLLEGSGVLIAQRREQLIWADACANLTPRTVERWFADLPALGASNKRWQSVFAAAYDKMASCYLADEEASGAFSPWVAAHLAPQGALGEALSHLRERVTQGGYEALCLQAAHALSEPLEPPTACTLPDRWAFALESFAALKPPPQATFVTALCNATLRLRWRGQRVSVAGSASLPPSSADDLLSVSQVGATTSLALLRQLCDERRGDLDTVAASLQRLAPVATALGESTRESPWRLEDGRPVEARRFAAAMAWRSWLQGFATSRTPCEAMGLSEARCARCSELGGATADCDLWRRLSDTWQERTWGVSGAAAALVLATLLAYRGRTLWRLHAAAGPAVAAAQAACGRLGLSAARLPRWTLHPSRLQALSVKLPAARQWERWGQHAVIFCPAHASVEGRDIDEAGLLARAVEARLALLVHGGVNLRLGAMRTLLDWASRGQKAVQIVPVSVERLAYLVSPRDFLDLVDETATAGSPFDVRGRIGTSSQFYGRERLVSGLLSDVAAGRWVVITGLRRFGKSSLAMEVARRLPGPAGYVDTAGAHHLIHGGNDAALAAEHLLWQACASVQRSACELWPGWSHPPPPTQASEPHALEAWFADFAVRCHDRDAGAPMVLVFDEIEQAAGYAPLRAALQVFSILIGRLRAMLASTSRIALLFCSELHPILWAPLQTLAGQSMLGSLPSVCIPALGSESAARLMADIGARHGIGFQTTALQTLVAQSGGVPLILRRLGACVLELYDSTFARQGGLGAVEVGPQAASEAVVREAAVGAPVRTWVDLEIASAHSCVGLILRRLATHRAIERADLTALVGASLTQSFVASGMGAVVDATQCRARAEAAVQQVVTALCAAGVLQPQEDALNPANFYVPDNLLSTILRSHPT